MWLALDAETNEIVGVYIGARDEAAARVFMGLLTSGLSRSLRRSASGQCAIAYTDFWAAIL